MQKDNDHKRTAENYDIRILKDGNWMHEGRVITRHNLVKLFASVLKKESDGSYWLETPAERGPIIVDDLPFVAVELKAEGHGKSQILSFRTNTDDWVTADAVHPLTVTMDEEGSPKPAIMVRNGLEARINRAIYYELAALAVESDNQKGVFGLWSQQIFFPIGRMG